MNIAKPKVWTALIVTTLLAAAGVFLLLPDQDGATPAGAGLALYRADDITVGIATVPATPRVGENRLVVELKNADGEPISGAEFGAFAEMPAMGAMPAMRAAADLEETAPGHYEGVVDLSMRGEWPLTLAFETPGGASGRLQFDFATDRPGLQIAGGGTAIDNGSGTAATETMGEMAAEAADGPVITIDNRRRQMIGLETAEAEVRNLTRSIRAVGQVTYDERLLSQVTLKFDGFIGELNADYVGAQVNKGQVLFTVYSPDLLAAQREYLEVYGRANSDSSLLDAARQRLRLWDMSLETIAELERSGTPKPYVPIHAPRSGTVIALNVSEGSAAPSGEPLISIGDLSRVWIEAQVYEADLSLLYPGIPATVLLPYLPDRRYRSEVEYIYPFLAEETRTGRVRITLENEAGELKPEMYAEVMLEVALEERLSVPEEAVLVAGTSRVVFVDQGQGRLQAMRIKTGRRAQGYIEVLEGLEAGAAVVTSGNFLIAAETKLKTGIEQW